MGCCCSSYRSISCVLYEVLSESFADNHIFRLAYSDRVKGISLVLIHHFFVYYLIHRLPNAFTLGESYLVGFLLASTIYNGVANIGLLVSKAHVIELALNVSTGFSHYSFLASAIANCGVRGSFCNLHPVRAVGSYAHNSFSFLLTSESKVRRKKRVGILGKVCINWLRM